MRPVEANWYRDFLYNLNNTKTRYDDAISQASSGKRLNHLSDNPADMSYVLTLRSKIGQIDQFERNIDSGKLWLNTAESGLNQVQNVLTSIVSLASQGANESNGPNERNTIADSIEQMRDEIMNFANTEINGKYIFAGSATDTIPFTAAGVSPQIITYGGNSDVIAVQADFSIQVDTNIPGDQVFTGPNVDIFERLRTLITALRNDDTTGIGNEISNMHELVDQISQGLGNLGNRSAHLDQISGLIKSFKASLVDKMSSLEDANMAEALSNLGREEVGLQAALNVGSRINRQSLMNYLG